MANTPLPLDALRSALRLACQPQRDDLIVQGRRQVLDLPREWVLGHIEVAAAQTLDLSDEWEFRRLLELGQQLDLELLRRLILLGLSSHDPDLREAAEDFREMTG